jgi:hypothetical protein
MPQAYPSPPEAVEHALDAAMPRALRAWADTFDAEEAAYHARAPHLADYPTQRRRALTQHVTNAVEWDEAEPTPTFTIGFRGETVRPFLVLTGADGVKRAFYRSTGRSGGADSGDWIPFHGFVSRGRGEDLRWVWLVKEGKAKMPDPYDQPEAYRAYYLLRWAQRAGLIEEGVTRIVPDYAATLGNLKEAYEMLGEANRWLQFHGALANADRWRLPYREAPAGGDYNQLFPLIGMDLHFPTAKLRAWAKREGLTGAAAMQHDPLDALVKAGVLSPDAYYRRRRNPRVS